MLSADLPPMTVVPALMPQGPFALWRSESGILSLQADRCPHRGMRLSHGFVRGEALSCIYHGWRYAQNGRCLKIPAHPRLEPPEAIRVETYAVTESGGLIWGCLETPAGAPPNFDGFAPLRMMSVKVSPQMIATSDEVDRRADGALAIELAGQHCLFLARAQPDGSTLLFCLIEEAAAPEARIAVSRALELFRCRLEADDLQKEAL
ncbi:Rieske 2Fe-2S domain-containing protein [Rhizobium sp. SL86]|uniref:Rieske 2Fe-2S domain-containing protein n=1 Tax=Rhizobium sp. SL86 TaxID=2995148 RepID=UPI0022749EF1|nr:Rieske 2Fe-2S domain-containing protein [Rhizobium sp. SL86]MCY1666386.1 Rieske 2Fe-2S domain-containing protein [Rhizobium sp. SL86]